jgi:twitching motility protein PilT
VSQRLLPKPGGGRMAICEILRANSRTKEYIAEGEREGKSLLDAIEDGGIDGMQSFDQELERFINEGIIDREVGLSYATNRTNLELKLDTQGKGAEAKAAGPAIGVKNAPPTRRAPKPEPTPDLGLDDLIER